MAGRHKFVKPASSGSNTDFLSPTSKTGCRNKVDLIDSDVWGPAQNVSLGGSRYFISFIDDYTRHTCIYLIERKIEVFDCFWDLKWFWKQKQ